jgi:hypothetical protein
VLFCKHARADVVKKNPKMAITEIAKELGQMWGKLPDAKKAQWKEGKVAK